MNRVQAIKRALWHINNGDSARVMYHRVRNGQWMYASKVWAESHPEQGPFVTPERVIRDLDPCLFEKLCLDET